MDAACSICPGIFVAVPYSSYLTRSEVLINLIQVT
jgi:hypothetical protein